MHPGFNLPDPGDPAATSPEFGATRRGGVPEDEGASAAMVEYSLGNRTRIGMPWIREAIAATARCICSFKRR